ncbi:adenosine deaminase/editase [Phlyctochytrium arcticum]|nr:adenosine deaminase/editase [Phlyctochytrium arcticum]
MDGSLEDIADSIAHAVQTKFDSLPRKGKPTLQGNRLEWTVLAGIVQQDGIETKESKFQCVALGTGLKCLSTSQLAFDGSALNDSHAEVICRRGFVRYILRQVEQAEDGQSSILERTSDQNGAPYTLRHGTRFHLYISQAPCGDATMEAVLQAQTPDEMEQNERKKREHLKRKRVASENDIVDTSPPLRRGRSDIHVIGVLRTKPGRVDAEPTQSMSCSDKIAAWTVMGLNGALLSILVTPIYLGKIVVGDLYNGPALERALVSRVGQIEGLPGPFTLRHPKIMPTTIPFRWGKAYLLRKKAANDKIVPASTAITWNLGDGSSEALVNGRKQGSTKVTEKSQWRRSHLSRLTLGNSIARVIRIIRPSLLR